MPAATYNTERVTRILRIDEVERRTGLSKVSIYRLRRRGEFPAARKLMPGPGGRLIGFFEHEVEEWLKKTQTA